MAVTAVLNNEGSATLVTDNDGNEILAETRFSWSAAIAGGLISAAIALLLLAFGSGINLTLVSQEQVSTPSLVTLGAIFVFVALVLAFAIGGYVAGRLIEPARPDAKDERFRSAAHGLVAWAIATVGLAILVIAGSLASGNAAAVLTRPQTLTDDYVGYWVDMLFRPAPGPSQGSLGGTQFAQASTGNATDATQQPQAPNPAAVPSPDYPETSGPFANQPPPSQQQAPGQENMAPAAPSVSVPRSSSSAPVAPEDLKIPATQNGSTPLNLGADQAEVARIIRIGMADNAPLSPYDKDRITALITQDANLAHSDAQRRVDNAETRIHADMAKANEVARQIRSNTSLWIAASLLFGAIAASLAAMSARRRAEMLTFGWPRQEPQ